jgi:hypothetical protein
MKNSKKSNEIFPSQQSNLKNYGFTNNKIVMIGPIPKASVPLVTNTSIDVKEN